MHSLQPARVRLQVASASQPISRPKQSKEATVGTLTDEVLLTIFCYFLEASPQHWPTLMHICRKWRRIVFTSQRALHLQLFCTQGTPVQQTLDCWPTLPIVVQYQYDSYESLALEDENNMIVALKQSDRVSSITLTVNSSLSKQLSTIGRPFSELEDLVLLSGDGTPVTLPYTFRWGPHLRCLWLIRVIIPALPRLLDSSKNLVDLYLHEVHGPWFFPPEVLTNALTGMVQLRSLSLHFRSFINLVSPRPPSSELVVLPALTRLRLQGFSEYLEGLVARINAPLLGDIEVTFLALTNFDLSMFFTFTDRIGLHNSHSRADILFSEDAVSISLTRPGDAACLKLRSFGRSSSLHPFFMARICTHFSAHLLNVADLRISAKEPPRKEDGLDYKSWLELLTSFAGVNWLQISGNLSKDIVDSLQAPDRRSKSVLLTLKMLYILQPVPHFVPLREAVVSFMTSRRLSGHPIDVEYERPQYMNEIPGTGPFSHLVAIEKLSEDILLKIFRQFLGDTPHHWPMLVWVCQRWRQIVLSSPLGLNLRLYCTHGTPVLKSLDCWPSLPIAVQYGGVPGPDLDPSVAPQDYDNIVAALKQSGRVSSISLTVTSSLLEKLSTISEPFLQLKDLSLLSRENLQLALPSTFRWGQLLRTLQSTNIAFPSLPQLLLPCQDLVDIQLYDIPRAGYFSPESFANALSGMTRLETLSLHFLSLPPRRNYLRLPPQPEERAVLPSLTSLKYGGTSKYLDSFVARIDAPRLGDIDITFFSQPTMDASQLGRFIERIVEMQTLIVKADVESSALAISIFFTNSNTSPLKLRIPCTQFDWQLSCMAQVCDQFSPFLFRINDLGINTTHSPPGHNDVDGEQWPKLLRSFGDAKAFRVAGKLATDIFTALCLENSAGRTALPTLNDIRAEKLMTMHDAVQSFINSRLLSGHPVDVEVLSHQCHICDASFEQQQVLKHHLGDEHAYRICCSYCGDFECTEGRIYFFRQHLESKHPEIARNDALISNPSTLFVPFQLDPIINRHSSTRAPDIVAPSTTATAPHSQ